LNIANIRQLGESREMISNVPKPVLRRLAREQRAAAVQAESLLWRSLRDRRCEGAKFRRQVGLGNYIVDFVCFEQRLIVEVDGPSHVGDEQQAKDRDRDAWLREQGFRVLRVTNELVIAATEIAVARIRAALSG
jgi:very-short-patch-repair endonuclease